MLSDACVVISINSPSFFCLYEYSPTPLLITVVPVPSLYNEISTVTSKSSFTEVFLISSYTTSEYM